MSKKPRVVALEEHYWDADIAAQFDAAEARPGKMRDRLFEILSALHVRKLAPAAAPARS